MTALVLIVALFAQTAGALRPQEMVPLSKLICPIGTPTFEKQGRVTIVTCALPETGSGR
jgi:hypothetical protein